MNDAMRLWSVHPKYLDRQGFLACWREGLLAQKVLLGGTAGYRKHPQLARFRGQPDPLGAIGCYLGALADQAVERGYRFDRSKIIRPVNDIEMALSDGQLNYEWRHLLAKVAKRSPHWAQRWADVTEPEPHPAFTIVPGPIADWETARLDELRS